MDFETLRQELGHSTEMIRALLAGIGQEESRVRPAPDSWSILEVVCHLIDEEREDFREHLDFILHRRDAEWHAIDPEGWVTERGYNQRDFEDMKAEFFRERAASLEWLDNLGHPDLDTLHESPFGSMTAGEMLASWVAHDLARQIGADDYAIDAIHMLANISPPDESLRLNQEAIAMAESSDDERARRWLGSLYNNIGWAYHGLEDFAAALEVFTKAENWQRSMGRVNETRIAVWCVARMLRSLGRVEEGLSNQMKLLAELEAARETDGYVLEEIGECLLALDRAEEARAYFARAYEILSKDRYLSEQEPERLRRLSELAGSGQPSNG